MPTNRNQDLMTREPDLRYGDFGTVGRLARLFCVLISLTAGSGSVVLVASHPVVERSTNSPPLDLLEAIAHFRAGNYSECILHIAEKIEDGFQGEDWFELKARAEMETGLYVAALRTIEEGLTKNNRSIRLRWLGRNVARFNDDSTLARLWLDEIEELATRSWRYRGALDQIVLGQMELEKGFDPKSVLEKRFFPAARERYQGHLAVGKLGLDKGDFSLAAEHFENARKRAADDPDVQFGLARSYATSSAKKASESIEQALKLNPRHIPSLLFLSENRIDEENYSDAKTIIDKVLKVNAYHPRANALLAVIAHLQNEAEQESHYREVALSQWRGNPEVDHCIGRKLSQKYRFAEGAVYQKRALVYDPQYLPAKIQLGQDLLRLGREAEGWELADSVYREDGYNIVAHNLVTLRANIERFATIESEGFVVRMDPREAEIYGQRVLDLLIRAKQKLSGRYEFEISEPVYVEIFPRQQDFAIRTFGLPGGAGYLGVCFGKVITMNSPRAQGPSPTNWESVLWHEFCHVITLQKSNNKMPRWLSEGISVFEETREDPAWGQSMNASYVKMILGDDLTPVSELSGAFLQPKSPAHLDFAYFESSLVVRYLVEKHGIETLNRVLDDLAIGMTINQALQRYTGSTKVLDREFAEYAKGLAKSYAKGVSFDPPKREWLVDPKALESAAKAAPKNFPLQVQLAQSLLKQKEWKAAREVCDAVIELHSGSPEGFLLLARSAKGLGDRPLEMSALKKLVALDSDQYEAECRLAQMAVEDEDWSSARASALSAIAINPLLPKPHSLLAKIAEQLEEVEAAVAALKALTVLDPVDPADVQFRLARALFETGDLESARVEVLRALENAPRYREALSLLLKIRGALDAKKRGPSTTNPSGMSQTRGLPRRIPSRPIAGDPVVIGNWFERADWPSELAAMKFASKGVQR